MSAERLDAMDDADAEAALARCCGSSTWVRRMLAARPFGDDAALHAAAAAAWEDVNRDDVLEALSHHPEIGADLERLREKFASTANWSEGEQASVASADEATLVRLRDGNVAYRERHGHIFVVCATGKSAAQMLALLEARIDNDPEDELWIAAAEQAKITRIRLEKL